MSDDEQFQEEEPYVNQVGMDQQEASGIILAYHNNGSGKTGSDTITTGGATFGSSRGWCPLHFDYDPVAEGCSSGSVID